MWGPSSTYTELDVRPDKWLPGAPGTKQTSGHRPHSLNLSSFGSRIRSLVQEVLTCLPEAGVARG